MIPIDRTRFLGWMNDLASIGALAGGGVQRLAFTAEDRAGRDWTVARMRELGLEVHIDPLGNVLGVRAGTDPAAPLVLMGSHTDTVGRAGRFDGSLGVVAGLEAVAAMNDAGVATRAPVGVVSFMNEEGVRFMPDMMGSLYVTGQWTLDVLRAVADADGATIGAAIDAGGFAGDADWRALPIAAFVELHIEQGPVLEEVGAAIGVVEGVQGLSWTEIAFSGASNHAGTTPMTARRDAGRAAAALMAAVHAMAGEPLRATVGTVRFAPNLINVIPREAVVTVDLRHPDEAALAEAEALLEASCHAVALKQRVNVATRRLARTTPAAFDARLVDAVAASAAARGYTHRRMISGAGHDAQIMASRYPSAMIFVPSRDGISHDPAEYTAPDHLVAGAEVLLDTVRRAAG